MSADFWDTWAGKAAGWTLPGMVTKGITTGNFAPWGTDQITKGLGIGGGSQVPQTPNFMGLANQQADIGRQNTATQTLQNRPDQYNAFGSSTWGVGPDGRPMQTTSLNPEDQGRLEQQRGYQSGQLGLGNMFQNQIANNGAFSFGGMPQLNPFNGRGLPGVGSGADYQNQAENALMGRATARLDPQWDRRNQQQQTQLLNQGLDPSSEAYKNSMQDFNMSRNDAYSSAMNDAITGGGAEASRLFGMDMSRRQQGLGEQAQGFNQSLGARQQLGGEQVQQYQMPFQGLAGSMAGYQNIGNPQFQGFNAAGVAPTPNLLGASEAQSGADLSRYGLQQKAGADQMNGMFQMGGAMLPFLI